MIHFALVVIACCTLGILFTIYMMARNEWVYRQRTRILNNSRWDGHRFVEYEQLPSYDEMLWRVLVWDIRKFQGDGNG